MTREDIIHMAWEARIHKELVWDSTCHERVERFAALVAAHEREACARLCEQADEEGEGPDSWGWHSKDFAKAIRARGNT